MASRTRAVLGFKAHTGWAAVVALAGPASEPRVLSKRRLELAPGFDAAAVYHASEALPVEQAAERIAGAERAFTEAAQRAISAVQTELAGAGVDLAGAAVVGEPRSLPPLASILASHALIHTAEGVLFRGILVRACQACRISAELVSGKALDGRLAKALGMTSQALAARLAELGKASGRPWAADQKESALAAWWVLAGG